MVTGRASTTRRPGLAQSGRELISRSPARAAALVFLAAGILFALLLSLPLASASGQQTRPEDAVFTAISAVTVTGLMTVGTASHWSFFGQAVILVAIQAGGLGIVTLALLLARAVTRQLGVRGKIFAQQSIGTSQLGEVGALLRIVVRTTLVIEAALVVILTPRFIMLEDNERDGIWHGLFYGVSAFNNAGFILHSRGLAAYDGDYWVLVPIMVGVFVGSFGFPVFLTLITHRWHYRRWTLHAKLTLALGGALLSLGRSLGAHRSGTTQPPSVRSLSATGCSMPSSRQR